MTVLASLSDAQRVRIRELYRRGWSRIDLMTAFDVGNDTLDAVVHPDRERAYVIYNAALRGGDLCRPDRCERCGQEGEVQGHHADYSRPLDVEWLCVGCHARHHTGDPRRVGRPHPTPHERRAVWFVALARGVEWAELLEDHTVEEIVARYDQMASGGPTLAEADARDSRRAA